MAQTKVVLPFAVALFFAVVGAFMAYNWVQSQRPAAEAQRTSDSGDIMTVAVAAATIPWGTQLSTETIEMKAFLKKSLPAVGYFTDPAALFDRVAITPLEPGDIILESRLAPTGVTTGGVAAVVTPGNRAIAVKGDKVVGLAGLIRPRDRVDVLVTINNGDAGNAEQVTKVVLENILVLAAGPQMQKGEKGESPVDVYTLEVTPDDGEKLALASNEGKLHFALRNITDNEIVLTRGATVVETLDSYRARSNASPTAQPLEVSAGNYSVEVIRGTSRDNVDF
jgi:pilus assembly protein CpaB